MDIDIYGDGLFITLTHHEGHDTALLTTARDKSHDLSLSDLRKLRDGLTKIIDKIAATKDP